MPVVAALVLSASSCGGASETRTVVTIEPRPPSNAPIELGGRSLSIGLPGLAHVTSARSAYKFSESLCRSFGPARVAFDYGDKGGTLTEIAQRYSQAVFNARFPQASSAGCVAGFKRGWTLPVQADPTALNQERRDFLDCLRREGVIVSLRRPAARAPRGQLRYGFWRTIEARNIRVDPAEQAFSQIVRGCQQRPTK